MKLLGRIAVAVAVIAVIYAVLVRMNQQRWLFQPATYPGGDWKIQRIYGAQDKTLVAADGSRLLAWWIPAEPAHRTVLFFHSRRGNISDQAERILRLQDLGSNVFLLDYRGYGKSAGRPSIAGIDQDGETAYQYVIQALKVDPRHLVVQGDELGSAVAASVASHHPEVAALVLESPFPSLRALGNATLPFGGWLMSDDLNVKGEVQRYPGPKLILFASDDANIPAELSQQVFDAAAQPKVEHEVMGGAEDTLVVYAGPNYKEWMQAFYAQIHLPTPQDKILPKQMPAVIFGR